MKRLKFSALGLDATDRLPRVLEVLLGIVVLLELIAPFTPKSYGLDGGAHLNWIHQFSDLVVAGNWIPRWVPNAFGGFGGATFYFYPPFTYYVASIIRLLSGIATPTTLYQVTGLVGTLASFATCFVLIRSLQVSTYYSMVAALLYAFGPLRMLDLYNRCSLSSHMAYIFFPLAWLGLLRIVSPVKGQTNSLLENTASVIILAVAMAFLGITSVPLAAVMIVVIVVWLIVSMQTVTFRAIWFLVISGLLSIGLAGFHYGAVLDAGSYIRLKGIPQVPQIFGLSLGELPSPEIYNMLLLYGSVVFLALRLWHDRKDTKAKFPILLGWFLLTITIIMLVIDSPGSKAIWEHSLFLQLIQFGSRFATQVFLAIVMLAGIAPRFALRRMVTVLVWVWTLAAFGPATLVALNLHLKPHSEAIIGDALEYRPLDTPHRNAFIIWLHDHAGDPAVYASIQPGESLSVHPGMGTNDTIDVNLSERLTVTLHRFAWPFWKVYSGDSTMKVGADSVGRAVITLPPGHYSLRSAVETGTDEIIGRWISIGSVLGVICWYTFATWRDRWAKTKELRNAT